MMLCSSLTGRLRIVSRHRVVSRSLSSSSTTPQNNKEKAKNNDKTATDKSNDPKIPMQGQFKNPIVAKLWAMRHDAKERLGLTDDGTTSTTEITQAAQAVMNEPKEKHPFVLQKTPAESATAISYPFSTDEFLLESYRNPWGQMRFGKILEVRIVIYLFLLMS